jgi:sugar phosphate isomerase/epimerase
MAKHRAGKKRRWRRFVKLGLDLYSVRSQEWDAKQKLNYCQKLGFGLAHFGLGDLGTTDGQELRAIKAYADQLGIEIEVGTGSICETSPRFQGEPGDAVEATRQALHIAHLLGSRALKVLLGGFLERQTPEPLETHIQSCISTLKAVREQALDLGITLAVENHQDLQGCELKALIEEAGTEYVGACLDSGNAVYLGEDPLVVFEHVAPYVVASHIRDSAVWPHPKGAAYQWVAMGEGNVGIETLAARYQAECTRARAFTLEILTGNPPRVLPYLEISYWNAFPNARANEFARFERLVRRGQPYAGTMVAVERGAEVPTEYEAALKAQQLYDVERSIAYCQETLGLGE